jgi:predicted DNA-binding antitoxin AbrB/MazE fold protein
MSTVRAVFEDGVFRPSGKVDLPDRCEVEFEPKIVSPGPPHKESLAGIYEVLARSYETGDPRIAELHNEHQP